MKIVYFSSDRLEVERISQELVLAGIPCEVREGAVVKEAELWIKKDSDKVKMKAFGDVLSDDEIKALVAYTRAFKK